MFTRPNTLPLRAIAASVALIAAASPAWAQEEATPTPEAAPEIAPEIAPEAAPTAETSDGFLDSLANGDVGIKLLYRFENVDQDGISDDATASTLRTALKYSTQSFNGFNFVLEFEDVRQVFGENSYNDTINPSNRPVIADPEGTEVNQGYMAYGFGNDGRARLGRQEIKLDNDRFIGNVGWRQNHQSFDALSVNLGLGERANVYAAYVNNVNRIFGEQSPNGDARMDTILLNANMDVGIGNLVGYWYNLDYADVVVNSTSTIGLRLTGTPDAEDKFGLIYSLEAATQTDVGDNPNNVSAEYYLAELGAKLSGVALKLGFESLGGSTVAGEEFETPLATLHGHNGWADKFLTTPTGGLEDAYLSANVNLGKTSCMAVYHDFQAETGGGSYGTELDLQVKRPFGDSVSIGLKYANYMEDGFLTDTEKIWAWMGVSI